MTLEEEFREWKLQTPSVLVTGVKCLLFLRVPPIKKFQYHRLNFGLTRVSDVRMETSDEGR